MIYEFDLFDFFDFGIVKNLPKEKTHYFSRDISCIFYFAYFWKQSAN